MIIERKDVVDYLSSREPFEIASIIEDATNRHQDTADIAEILADAHQELLTRYEYKEAPHA